MERTNRAAKSSWLLLVAWAFATALPTRGAAADDEIRAAETVVHQIYFESLPYEAARALTPRGGARLLEMLADPDERTWAPNLCVAIGIAAPTGAYEALAAAADAGQSGEVDAATYRLQRTLPFAMGHLAREDERALAWLIERSRVRRADAGWSFGSRSGQVLADRLRHQAIAGLGLSGRPEAEAALRAIALEAGRRMAGGDPGLAEQVAVAREVRARIATLGPEAALRARHDR